MQSECANHTKPFCIANFIDDGLFDLAFDTKTFDVSFGLASLI